MFDWDGFAVVTDLEWISRTTKFMAMLMPMEGRVYPMAEAAKAREWISETPLKIVGMMRLREPWTRVAPRRILIK